MLFTQSLISIVLYLLSNNLTKNKQKYTFTHILYYSTSGPYKYNHNKATSIFIIYYNPI